MAWHTYGVSYCHNYNFLLKQHVIRILFKMVKIASAGTGSAFRPVVQFYHLWKRMTSSGTMAGMLAKRSDIIYLELNCCS